MNIHEYNNVGGKTHQIHVENDDKPSDFRGAPFLDNRKPCFPKVWGGSCNYTFFFPVGPVRKLKMPSQEKIIPAWMLQGWGSGKQMLEPGKQD